MKRRPVVNWRKKATESPQTSVVLHLSPSEPWANSGVNLPTRRNPPQSQEYGMFQTVCYKKFHSLACRGGGYICIYIKNTNQSEFSYHVTKMHSTGHWCLVSRPATFHSNSHSLVGSDYTYFTALYCFGREMRYHSE